MEHEAKGPEHQKRLLIQREQQNLFDTMARTLVLKGTYEAVSGVYTPADRPDALAFRIDTDTSIVKDIFYPDEDVIEFDAGDTYLNYMTPHALGDEETDEPGSSVYFHIGGWLRDSDVAISIGYLITREGNELYSYTGKVEYEFSRDRRVIDEDIVQLDDGVVLISSYRRDISQGDAERIRELLLRI